MITRETFSDFGLIYFFADRNCKITVIEHYGKNYKRCIGYHINERTNEVEKDASTTTAIPITTVTYDPAINIDNNPITTTTIPTTTAVMTSYNISPLTTTNTIPTTTTAAINNNNGPVTTTTIPTTTTTTTTTTSMTSNIIAAETTTTAAATTTTTSQPQQPESQQTQTSNGDDDCSSGTMERPSSVFFMYAVSICVVFLSQHFKLC